MKRFTGGNSRDQKEREKGRKPDFQMSYFKNQNQNQKQSQNMKRQQILETIGW